MARLIGALVLWFVWSWSAQAALSCGDSQVWKVPERILTADEIQSRGDDLLLKISQTYQTYGPALGSIKIGELLERTYADLLSDGKVALVQFTSDPKRSSLNDESSIVSGGTRAMVDKIERIEKLLDPDRRLNRLFSEKSRQAKVERLADELVACRNQTSACIDSTRQKVEAFKDYLEILAGLHLRFTNEAQILAAITRKSLLEIPDHEAKILEQINGYLTRLQLTASVLEGHLQSVENQLNTHGLSVKDFQDIEIGLMRAVAKGAPSRILQVPARLSDANLEPSKTIRDAAKINSRVMPMDEFLLHLRSTDGDAWLANLGTLLNSRTTVSDAQIKFVLDHWPGHVAVAKDPVNGTVYTDMALKGFTKWGHDATEPVTLMLLHKLFSKEVVIVLPRGDWIRVKDSLDKALTDTFKRWDPLRPRKLQAQFKTDVRAYFNLLFMNATSKRNGR